MFNLILYRLDHVRERGVRERWGILFELGLDQERGKKKFICQGRVEVEKILKQQCWLFFFMAMVLFSVLKKKR